MRAAAFALLLARGACASIVRTYSDLQGAPYTITRDARSLRFNDVPALLVSGSIHYPRSTPAMWPHLFREAKANGLNAIECCERERARSPALARARSAVTRARAPRVSQTCSGTTTARTTRRTTTTASTAT